MNMDLIAKYALLQQVLRVESCELRVAMNVTTAHDKNTVHRGTDIDRELSKREEI
jgi:hypothetical protein